MTPEQAAAEIARLHECLRDARIVAECRQRDIERLAGEVARLRQGEQLAKASVHAADVAEKNAVEAAAVAKYHADNNVRWAREEAAEQVRAARAEAASARAEAASARAEAQVWQAFGLAVAQVVGAPEPTPRDLQAVLAAVQASASGGQP
jgi:hypothetical protein